MKVEVRAEGIPMTKHLRAFVERKLRLALGRFGERVRAVRVRLTDINGPRNGEDIRCHIQASVAHGRTLTIQEQRTDPFSAVARATDRAQRSVARQIGRLKRKRQGRGR